MSADGIVSGRTDPCADTRRPSPARRRNRPAAAWWILHAGPWVALAAAIAYGVARGATAAFYRPLGITPDDAGVGVGRTLVQTFSLLGLLAALLVSMGAVAAVARHVVGGAAVPGKRRPAGDGTPVLVALGPLLALTVEAWTIERRTAWGWAAGVTIAVGAGLWVVAVRDPVRPAGRTVVAAALGAAGAGLVALASWYAPTTTAAFLFASFLVVALLVALGGDVPAWRRARRYLPPLLLLSTVCVAVALSRGGLGVWLLLVLPFAVLGAWLGLAQPAGRRSLAGVAGAARSCEPGPGEAAGHPPVRPPHPGPGGHRRERAGYRRAVDGRQPRRAAPAGDRVRPAASSPARCTRPG